jgi:hypothetical protein
VVFNELPSPANKSLCGLVDALHTAGAFDGVIMCDGAPSPFFTTIQSSLLMRASLLLTATWPTLTVNTDSVCLSCLCMRSALHIRTLTPASIVTHTGMRRMGSRCTLR